MRFSYLVGLLWILSIEPCLAEVVDRIVAVVDREVITLSETEVAREIVAVRGGGPSEELALPLVVERLIETRLMERELRRYRGEPVPPEQTDAGVEAIRESFPSHESFQEALAARGMNEESLRHLIRRQIAISRYLERRFWPLVNVTEEEAQRYYEEELQPTLRESGGVVPPYEEVADGIRQIVAEQEFNQRVDDWIEGLKSRSRIRRFVW